MRRQHLLSRLLPAAALLFLAVIGSAGGQAAPPRRWESFADTAFQHVAEDAGLPNAAIPTSIVQDGSGFLWVGSQHGLTRWDGYSFHGYVADAGLPGSLPDDYILALFCDHEGRLWAGTNAGGLALYDKARDRFISYSAGPHGLSHVRVEALADDGSGGLWVATDGGLDRLNTATEVVEQIHHREGDPASLMSNLITALLRDRAGTLWVGTSNGLERSTDDGRSFIPVPLPTPGHQSAFIRSLSADSSGRIWVGTARQGAYVVDAQARSSQPVVETEKGRTEKLATETVVSIEEARPGEVWLATFGQGIVKVDTTTMETRRIRHDPTQPRSLGYDMVWSLYRDRSGLLWVATSRTLSRIDPQQSGLLTIFGGTSRRNGFTDPDIESLLTMPDGRVWVGLGNNGIDIVDPVAGHVDSFRPDPAHPETALPQSIVSAFEQGRDGRVYVGTHRGLFLVDPRTRAVKHLSLADTDALPEVWALLRDGDRIWVGTLDGLWSLNDGPGDGSLSAAVDVSRFTDRSVVAIVRQNNGVLWIGTQNGIDRYDPVTDKVLGILPDKRRPGGLSSGMINALLLDRRGRLWVGTAGGGLEVVVSGQDSDSPVFHRIDLSDGLPNNAVDTLIEDKAGRIWISTDNGLAVIDPDTFAVKTMGQADGAVVSNYWSSSGTLTTAGEVLFGGIGGLTVIRPGRLNSWTYLPPVVVTSVRIGGKPVLASWVSKGNAPSETAKVLEIHSSADSIAVEFAALDYSDPYRLRYSYRLDGYDRDWIETDAAHRVAAYTNLLPGSYTLRIRGSNRDGVWSDSVLLVPIRVLPMWYQALWFRLAECVAVVLLVAILIQGITRRLRSRQRDLERCVAERTAELEESRRQLERMAYFDFLTGLPNRRMFADDFRKLLALELRRNERFSLLLMDLDDFKEVNDTLGHDAGDAILIEVASRLRNATRESDSVARLGGDEFAILLAGAPEGMAPEHACRRILDEFGPPVLFKHHAIHVRISVGVAIFPDDGRTPDDLYKQADIALYRAKQQGNSVCFYAETLRG
ncbi:two-component regulator propeller domain-containing protein [Silvibacterium acidisoli]|uniref:two-component regulator propeller domain-containing protein n=1 Tax=Acidobacteriaceae bacterium ZG23-2 TaxID=2883246 RepID=UPI00406C289C